MNFSEAAKENYKFNSCSWLCYALASNNKFGEAENELNNMKTMMEKRKNPRDDNNFYQQAGFLEYKRNNKEKALDCFSKGSQTSPFNRYYKALIYETMGDKEKAKELLKKLESRMISSIPFTLVHNRAMKKLQQL